MQTTSTSFTNYAQNNMRPLSWLATAAFTREVDPSRQFFTVGVSTVGGNDIIPGTGDVLQNWDLYLYTDYSQRLISMEWSRTEDQVSSVTSSIGDLTFDNSDGLFSADDFSFPFRPFKLYAGFGGENIPVFVGVSDAAPTLDETSKTMSVHVIDFMSTLYDRPLEEDVILQSVRTDQALDAILQSAGLSPTQYVLDTAFNTIPFVYFAAGSTFGDAAAQLMTAELGTLYMSEAGVITFKNRQDYNDTVVASFTRNNVIDFTTKTQDGIINVVNIVANVRTVVADKNIYTFTGTPLLVSAGGTAQLWADFQDPVISVDAPLDISVATTSSYIINTASDGSGTTANITISSTAQFSTSYQINFSNTNAFDVYVTQVILFGQPAEVTSTLNVRQQDDTSVANYDEQTLEIDNDFIQTEVDAISKAQIILQDYSNYGSVRQITVKGSPAYQIRDTVELGIDETTYVATSTDTWSTIAALYSITTTELQALNPNITSVTNGTLLNLGIIPALFKIKEIDNTLAMPANFKQILTVHDFTPHIYFTVGVSSIGSTDEIAP